MTVPTLRHNPFPYIQSNHSNLKETGLCITVVKEVLCRCENKLR